MLKWINDNMPYFELLYYVAGIGLFASVLIGLKQLSLLKSDLKDKNTRAAMEKSIEYLDWFASDFIPQFGKFVEKYKELRQSLIEPLNSSQKEVFLEKMNQKLDVRSCRDGKFILDDFQIKASELKRTIMLQSGAETILNQLELFAAVMTSGLADEEMAFTPLSDMYCSIVEDLLCVLGTARHKSDRLFTNVIKLYETWKPRIDKQALQTQHEEISKQMAQIKDVKVKPIGL